MADGIAIKVENLHKTFKLPHERTSSIKSAIINFRRRKKSFEKQHVLKNVSFEIQKGEFFGIVGRNGSGKSTLLKLLAGIYTPDRGTVQINGKLTPFIELGVGFNPELTGRENVYLNGALLGFNRKDMDAMYDDIVSFAELERFMDQKLKNYSSGMQVRLAFSIAIRAETDILLIDEVLAVGDAAFQQKCFEYFDKLKENRKTIILVTHEMGAVRQFCDRALFISDGEIKQIGSPDEISQTYERANFAQDGAKGAEEDDSVAVRILGDQGRPKTNFEYGDDVLVEVGWPPELSVGIVGIVIYKGVEPVFATNTLAQNYDLSAYKATLRMKALIGDGRYKVTATIFGSNRHETIATSKGHSVLMYGHPKTGKHNEEWQGVTYLENEWVR
jgi:ABC-2 type transport system ATP-binding protein